MRLLSVIIVFLFILGAGLISGASPAWAEGLRRETVNGLNGKPFFTMAIANEGSTIEHNSVDKASEYTLDDRAVNAVKNGAEYWTWLLNDHIASNEIPIIGITTENIENSGAAAISFSSQNEDFQGMTDLGAVILGRAPSVNAVDAVIFAFKPKYSDKWWYTGDVTSLPLNEDEPPLSAIMLHEIGHAVGIAASSTGDRKYFTDDNLSLYTQGLRNEGGDKPGAGELIEDFLPNNSNRFRNEEDFVYFTGTQVDEVLNGARLSYPDDINIKDMLGIPINGWERNKDDQGNLYALPELSHIELQNSLMSHQNYRNWGTLMEAELAILQDIGYSIDRRNFYGYSVYNDNKDETSNNPYFARNANGTAFIPGEYNATPWGIGLHIYGSNNEIDQAADILSSGRYGIGIRVDGVGNDLTINPNTKVHANGFGGNALAVTYGKDHNIVHRGDLTAQNGTALRFDFGSNVKQNRDEYRGSWLRIAWDEQTKEYKKISGINPTPALEDFPWKLEMPEALQGSLVEFFDVTGSLVGREAIYIADNAHVKNINIMNGAYISGDIISEWDPSYALLEYDTGKREDLLTNLTFGRKADTDGISTTVADPNFALNYTGHILGDKSILMSVEGGQLTHKGMAQVYSVAIKNGATLAATGRYKVGLNDKAYGGIDRSFKNEGMLLTYNPANLADKSGLSIEAREFDSSAGGLGVLLNSQGIAGGLTLEGAAANQDETFSELFIAPAQDYYLSEVIIDPKSAVKGAKSVDFTDTDLALRADFTSPTLIFAVSGSTDTMAKLLIQRSENAYNQYANSGASRGTASMIYNIADFPGVVAGDMKTLIGTLDFSDGSTVTTALEQLSGESVQGLSQTAIKGQQTMSGALIRNMLAPAVSSASSTLASALPPSAGEDSEETTWQAFSSVFGVGQKQRDVGDKRGYSASGLGLMGGLEHTFDSGLKAGMHLALQQRKVDSNNADQNASETNSVSVGIHGLFKPTDWQGGYVLGQLRGGMENNDMTRYINFDTYTSKNESDWTAYTFSATVGGGWDMTNDNITAGPVGWLDYSALRNPAFTESANGASVLSYQGHTLQSLRASLGGRLALQHTLESQQTQVQVDLLAAWQHEFMDNYGSNQIGFAGYEAFSVSQENTIQGRDSLFLQLGTQATFNEQTTLRLQVGSEFFREGYSSFMGDLSIVWEF